MKEVTLLGDPCDYRTAIHKNGKHLSCPMNQYAFCGEVCAWFDIDEQGDYEAKEGTFFPVMKGTMKVITCKGTPIAKLVEDSK